jgi:hypothetical protein
MTQINYKIIDKEITKLDILKNHPYGKCSIARDMFGKNYNLKKVHISDHYQNKTDKEILYLIIEDVARAMSYLTLSENDSKGFARQKLLAFALWQVFHVGISGYEKEILKGKSDKEKLAVVKTINKRERKIYPKIYGEGYAMAPYNENEKETLKFINKYGVYVHKVLPLTPFSNSSSKFPTINYTKQELCAIHHQVIDYFENLC